MNVEKLFKAASMISPVDRTLALEITRIAQELSDTPLSKDPASPFQADPAAQLNPEIKNFASPSSDPEEKVTHKITLTLAAPKSLGELEVMNEVLPVINQIKGKKGIDLKGYQFTQS